MSPGCQEKNHAATCISAGRCVHKLKTPDRIFHRYIVLFKTFEFIFFFFFVVYIFDFNQIPHGQLHVFNVCLLFTHRITLSSTLNISRLSQQAPSPFFSNCTDQVILVSIKIQIKVIPYIVLYIIKRCYCFETWQRERKKKA